MTTPTSEELEDLAARCESASAGTWGLSEEICRALAGPNGNYSMRDVTTSLDAAKLLQPSYCTVLVEQQLDGWRVTMWADRMTPIAEATAKTEALARAAAALRAIAKERE